MSPGAVEPSRSAIVYLVAPDREDLDSFRLPWIQVVIAADAQDALARVRDQPPHVLVINLSRGGDDAARLCGAARGCPAGAAVLVICDSVNGVPGVLRAGCHAVLMRPLMRNLVAARIGRLLKRGASGIGAFAPKRVNHIGPSHCPVCLAPSPIGFDAVGLRRWWFACLACDHTWIATVRDRPAMRRRSADALPRGAAQ